MFFGLRKKKIKGKAEVVIMEALAIFAPDSGEMNPLSSIDDPKFRKDMTGQGVLIQPTGDVVGSPFIGTVSKVLDRGRAIKIDVSFGVFALIYLGLSSDNLKKEHFEACVMNGDVVGPGDPLIRFDREGLEESGADMMIRVIVCDNDKYDFFDEPEVRTIKKDEMIAALPWIFPIDD